LPEAPFRDGDEDQDGNQIGAQNGPVRCVQNCRVGLAACHEDQLILGRSETCVQQMQRRTLCVLFHSTV
jgi:hypothetical protein